MLCNKEKLNFKTTPTRFPHQVRQSHAIFLRVNYPFKPLSPQFFLKNIFFKIRLLSSTYLAAACPPAAPGSSSPDPDPDTGTLTRSRCPCSSPRPASCPRRGGRYRRRRPEEKDNLVNDREIDFYCEVRAKTEPDSLLEFFLQTGKT